MGSANFRRSSTSHGRAFAITFVYCVVAWTSYLSLQPFDLLGDWSGLGERLSTGLAALHAERWLSHIVMGAALGAGLATLAPNCKPTLPLLTLLAFGLTLELAQVCVASRHPRLGDLVLHLVAAILTWLLTRRVARRRELTATWDKRIRWLSRIAALALLAIVFVLPLDATRHTNLMSWDPDYPLILGDEATLDRTWYGTIAALAIFDRCLDPSEARRLIDTPVHETGKQTRRELGAIHFYHPEPPFGLVLEDRIGTLDLPIQSRSGNRPTGTVAGTDGLKLDSELLVRTPGAATSLTRRIASSAEFSVELLCRSSDPAQFGPARIVSCSDGPFQRNFTIAQNGDALALRIRSPAGGANGEYNETQWAGVFADGTMQHLVITYAYGRPELIRDRSPAPTRTVRMPRQHPAPDLARRPTLQALLLLLPIGLLCGLGWETRWPNRILFGCTAALISVAGHWASHLWTGVPVDPAVAVLAALLVPIAATLHPLKGMS